MARSAGRLSAPGGAGRNLSPKLNYSFLLVTWLKTPAGPGPRSEGAPTAPRRSRTPPSPAPKQPVNNLWESCS